MAAIRGGSVRQAARIRFFLASRPEWWTLAICATAWAVLTGREFGGISGHHPVDPGTSVLLSAWMQNTADWLLMVAAMMLPVVVFSIRVSAARSLWRRRHRAIGGFLIGYIGPWVVMGAGLAGVAVEIGLERWLHGLPWLAGAGFGVAAAWHLAPARQRAVRGCHRTAPLAPDGWRADRDCLHFGWSTGCQCLISCWALMVACVLAGHTLAAMAGATTLAVAERYFVRARQRIAFGPLLSLGLVYGVLGLAATQSG
ncbi:MAG: DUF2182 domain-containing protein [Chloroflexota bacterium]